jgi:hypothetical protein
MKFVAGVFTGIATVAAIKLLLTRNQYLPY